MNLRKPPETRRDVIIRGLQRLACFALVVVIFSVATKTVRTDIAVLAIVATVFSTVADTIRWKHPRITAAHVQLVVLSIVALVFVAYVATQFIP
jgi:hypothetical protein